MMKSINYDDIEVASILPPKTYENRKFHKAYQDTIEELEEDLKETILNFEKCPIHKEDVKIF